MGVNGGEQLALAIRLEAFRRLTFPGRAPWWVFGWLCGLSPMWMYPWNDVDLMLSEARRMADD